MLPSEEILELTVPDLSLNAMFLSPFYVPPRVDRLEDEDSDLDTEEDA